MLPDRRTKTEVDTLYTAARWMPTLAVVGVFVPLVFIVSLPLSLVYSLKRKRVLAGLDEGSLRLPDTGVHHPSSIGDLSTAEKVEYLRVHRYAILAPTISILLQFAILAVAFVSISSVFSRQMEHREEIVAAPPTPAPARCVVNVIFDSRVDTARDMSRPKDIIEFKKSSNGFCRVLTRGVRVVNAHVVALAGPKRIEVREAKIDCTRELEEFLEAHGRETLQARNGGGARYYCAVPSNQSTVGIGDALTSEQYEECGCGV